MASKRKAFDEAEAYLDRAFAIARSGKLDPAYAHYLDVWARNGRAFQFYRSGQKDAAIGITEEALALIERCPRTDRTPESQIALTKMALCSNAMRVNFHAGEPANARLWQARMRECAMLYPQWIQVPVDEYSVLLAEGSFDEAEAELQKQVTLAHEGLNPAAEAYASHLLGQILFRQGDAERAFRCFDRTLLLWRALGMMEDNITTELVNAAFAALRAGLRAEALENLELLEARLDEGSLAELHCAKALAWAQASLRQPELEMKAELELYAAATEFSSRLRGASYLAQAVRGEAGLALVEFALNSCDFTELSASDVLPAMVTAVELGGSAWRQRAEALLPAAQLDDDANVWWECRKLLAMAQCAA